MKMCLIQLVPSRAEEREEISSNRIFNTYNIAELQVLLILKEKYKYHNITYNIAELQVAFILWEQQHENITA